ncbi:MAG: hypothetical protein GY849_21860 [Deltaproteobacteria bacterium]|nr:hypothetical protein [Deltaproteobacteria bacterium]
MPSKALEINLATSRVDVTVEDRFGILKEVMEKYPGVHTGLHTFLEEICHPLRNWEFIVNEARGYALNYFHVLKSHPRGPEAAKLYIDIFLEAMDASPGREIEANAADNLLFFIQKIMKEAGTRLHGFSAVMDYAFDRI